MRPQPSQWTPYGAEPASAATLTTRLGIGRQKINYHLRALESHQLLKVAEQRQWGGLTELLMVATAASYIVSPGAMGRPHRIRGSADRLSASYLIALAARIIREVNDLLGLSRRVAKRLPILSLDTEVRFRSAEDRAAFGTALIGTVNPLVSRCHDESGPGGRSHQLVIVAHPVPLKPHSEEPS
jgi:hypothetical protein